MLGGCGKRLEGGGLLLDGSGRVLGKPRDLPRRFRNVLGSCSCDLHTGTHRLDGGDQGGAVDLIGLHGCLHLFHMRGDAADTRSKQLNIFILLVCVIRHIRNGNGVVLNRLAVFDARLP